MALTALERKRNQLQRQREAEEKLPDRTYPFLAIPFFKYLVDDPNWSGIEMAFDMMGLAAPSFDDDSGPKSGTGEPEEFSPFEGYQGSIGRAEVMVGQLLDAATELAGIINIYKVAEITARLAELANSDLSDPAAKKQALADIVRLTKIRERLDKRVRWNLPQWKVKGD